MRATGGSRLEWSEIPAHVRTAVELEIGARVVGAVNQAGGFSPGLAARCRLDDGRRCFVKAVSPAQNPHACRIHRREAEIASRLPAWVPAPALRHVVDDGEWVVLVFDEVVGRPPAEPWTWPELDAVVPALVDLGRRLDPSPVADIQPIADKQRVAFRGWRRLASGDGPIDDVDPWVRPRLDELAAEEDRWETAAHGHALLHADLRADNLLITDDGGVVVVVDWPWACTGARFVDLAAMLPSVAMGGGPRPHEVIARYGLFAGVDEGDLRRVVVALAGFFGRASLDPPPAGIPAVRAFQRAQGETALGWLRTMWTS